MRISLVGPGRAGMGVALAARAAGHHIVAVAGRSHDSVVSAAEDLGAVPLAIGDPLPACDLVIVAVRDDAIDDVAAQLTTAATEAAAAVHLSGLASVRALDALADVVSQRGSFHPLQTMPSGEAGAARLAGAWIGITAEQPLFSELSRFAETLGATPFSLADHDKAIYHAAAAAAANFTLGALVMADDLMAVADVPFDALRPLVEAVVANSFELGARASLTGPVARGDVGTVASQMAAVHDRAPEWFDAFRRWVAMLAQITGRTDEFATSISGNGSQS